MGNELLDAAVSLQDAMIVIATGGSFDGEEYERLRKRLISQNGIKDLVPSIVRQNRTVSEFWSWAKHATRDLSTGLWAERERIIWKEFRPLLDYLEQQENSSFTIGVSETLEKLDVGHVKEIWHKALERKDVDPEGAITAARTLLESTCKTILDECGIEYDNRDDLPKLWHKSAKELNLTPSQHDEEAFKTILGSAQNIVGTIGNIRNKIGDAHGHGKRPVRPKPRHAELVVNLAGSMSAFLVSTWKERDD